MSLVEVPLLDLSQPVEQIAEACRKACKDHGFLFITNHGVAPEVVAAHAAAQRHFFALHVDQKRTILADDNHRGYTPIAEQSLDPEHSTEGDAKEGLYFGREVAADSAEASLPLHGPNQWPDEVALELPGYRQAVEAYLGAMQALGMRMLPVMALALDLAADHFAPYFTRPMTFLRPLHYLPIPSNEQEGRHAAGAHSDFGFLTLLWCDGTPGLQILYKGRWMDVEPPVPDALVVNIGDMLERWSVGRFASTVHRVVNPEGVERHSCAFFLEPSFDAVVAPIVLGEGGAAAAAAAAALERYPPITAGQYMLDRYAAVHGAYRQQMQHGAATTNAE